MNDAQVVRSLIHPPPPPPSTDLGSPANGGGYALDWMWFQCEAHERLVEIF